ncbi:hypothetical protein ACIHEI_37425 [Kitasatospora sp. NPDC051984]|uniref:hypothetical protein n=1 Tax=Kitasatospora sp. NPDC051984 TaxID=3364059 RepID=UPI0037CC7027
MATATTATADTTADTAEETGRPAPAPLTPAAARRMAIAERVLYGAGGVLAAVGPHTHVVPLHVAVLGAGAGTLAVLWSRTKGSAADLWLSSTRALPTLGLTGTYAASLFHPGSAWWEYVAPLAVAAASAAAAPFTRARGVEHHVLAAADAQEQGEEVEDPSYFGGLRRLWAEARSTGSTELVDLVQDDPGRPDFRAVILAPAGETVPSSVSPHNIAGVFDVPVEAVTIAPIPGSGPGRLALTVAPTVAAESSPEADDVRALWAERVAGPRGAAPGMQLVDYRLEADRLVVLVEADEGMMIKLARVPIARAMKVEDPDLVMIETDGMSTGVVTFYRQHPLISIREATVADLTMQPDGTVVIGLQHDGRPFRIHLFRPELGALTDLFVGAPGAGKSVALLTVLAAERISGVVSIVADAQNGMSLPEASGRTAHFGAGRAALGATLAAFCAVMDYREEYSAGRGWGSFTIGDPWPLVIATLDEINKVLSVDETTVHVDFRKWVAGMIGRVQLTGRKVGMGVRFAGQSIHLRELGDSEKVRANAKQGLVWLGRVNSSMTQRMATDMVGAATAATIIPIPPTFGGGGSAGVMAAWKGETVASGPVTAGCAWAIQEGQAVLTRVFRAVKENRTYPHLIRLLESAPIPLLTPAEQKVFAEAYAEALPYAELLLEHGNEEPKDGGGRRSRRGAPTGPTGSAVPTVPASAAPSLSNQIIGYLAAAGGVMRTRDIRRAVGVGTPDGPAGGYVDTLLGRMRDEGLVVNVGHGSWGLAPGLAPQGLAPEDEAPE